jgi:hypothetical protein
MVQPMVMRAHQHQVGQLGDPAIFPVADVVCVKIAGGAATGNRARMVAVLEGAAKPAVDLAGGSARADDVAVAFEPGFEGGITYQVSAFGFREQRAQVQ